MQYPVQPPNGPAGVAHVGGTHGRALSCQISALS
jgi:hypothetical protein